MRRWIVLVTALVVRTGGAAAVLLRPWSPGEPSHRLVAAAWLPVWDPGAADSVSEAVEVGGVREVSPTWATVRPDGTLALTPPPIDVVDRVREAGARLVPVVQNVAAGVWQGDLVAHLLGNPDRAEAHRELLVETAVREQWDGVDIDYEALPPEAGPALTEFVEALADDLHAYDLQLTVSVPARTGEETHAAAYDYRVLGAAADQVRVLAYDHAGSGSPPGPVAPLGWVRDVVAYAVEQVPEDKLMLGLATYGYDWAGGQGAAVTAAEAAALARRVGASPRWDADAAGVTFTYEADGVAHTVWFEDARSLAAKQELARDAGLRGVAVWRIGGEDPRAWTTLAGATGGAEEP
ncbi:glycosyl hydrolase family 18 protein [Blastococcus sp. SYSU D00669]